MTEEMSDSMEIEETNYHHAECTYCAGPLKIKVFVNHPDFPLDSHEPEDTNNDFESIDFSDIYINPYNYDKTNKINCVNYSGIENNILVIGNKMILLPNFNHDLEILHNYLIKFRTQIIVIRNRNFNCKVDGLPDSIINLRIYSNVFNQSVSRLPRNLKYLVIISEIGADSESTFDKSISRLPNTLEELVIMSKDFDRPVSNLPSNLKLLFIGTDNSQFDRPIDNLPDSIEKLFIYSESFSQKINKYPCSLRHIYFESMELEEGSFDNLPENLIELRHTWTCPTDHCTVDNLPNSLRILHLGEGYNLPLDNLPENLEYLLLTDDASSYNKGYENFPNSLLYVDVDDDDFYEKFSHIQRIISNFNYFTSLVNVFGYKAWGG